MNAFFRLFVATMALFSSNIFTMDAPASIRLQTSEGTVVVIQREIAVQSETIKNLIEDVENGDEAIPLMYMDQDDFSIFVHYLNLLYKISIHNVNELVLHDELKHLTLGELKKLIELSNYLDVPRLLQATIDQYVLKLIEPHSLQLFCEDKAFFIDILDMPSELLNMIGDSVKKFNGIISYVSNSLIKENDYNILQLDEHTQRVIKIISHLKRRRFFSIGEDCIINSWDSKSKAHIKVATSYSFIDARLSSSNNYLATRSFNGSVQIWDAIKNVLLHDLPGNLCFSWSSKSDLLATVNQNGQIMIWEAKEGRLLKTMGEHETHIQAMDWSSDECFLVTGSSDNMVRIWDIEKSECVQILAGHTGKISLIIFNPQRTLFATIGDDKKVCIWSSVTYELVREFSGHTQWIWDAKWDPSGERIATGSHDKTVRIWDIRSGECQHILLGHSNRVWSLSWRFDGLLLASGSSDATVRVWDTINGDCLKILEGHAGLILSLDWINAFEIVSGSGDHQVRVWELLDEKIIKNLTLDQIILLIYLHAKGDNNNSFAIDKDHHLYNTYSEMDERIINLFK